MQGLEQLQQFAAGAQPAEDGNVPVEAPKQTKKRGRGRPTNAELAKKNKRMKDDAGAPVPTETETAPDSGFHSDGPFTEDEKGVIDRFVGEFRTSYSMDESSFNNIIQNKERKLDDLARQLWQGLYSILPKRDHKAMQRHMRRRFHNYTKRGEWSAEEDEQLKAFHELQPAKWKWIGEQLNRMAEDCRDRWRNYVVCGGNRRTDHWDEAEEEELSIAVHDCMKTVKEASKKRAKEQLTAWRDDQDWEDQINFNDVSAKMGFSRSRLQCLQHWKAIRYREMHDKKKRRVSGKSQSRAGDLTKQVKNHYNKMLPGDKYQMLKDIRDTDATGEDQIPWSMLAQRSTMKWTLPDWKYSYTRMKDLVENRVDFPVTITQLLEQFETHHADDLEEKYDPTQDEAAAASAKVQANAKPDNMAIDPSLQSATAPTADMVPAEKGKGKGKRGRKSKKFKSDAHIETTPPDEVSAENVLQHPADQFFQQQLAGRIQAAPTANMSSVRDENAADGELPAIQKPYENDDVPAEETGQTTDGGDPMMLAAQTMEMMKHNGKSGE